MSIQLKRSGVTIPTLKRMKQKGEKIACLTAYDASFTVVLEDAGIDVILVGDSLGMVVQGYDTTIPVTMRDMVYHTRCVARANRRALLVSDMPFMSYTDPNLAMINATKLMQQGGAHMVKLESSSAQIETIARLSDHGVPVCAHLGLKPQSVYKLGGYRVQGRDTHSATKMLEDAVAIQQAGADVLLLECIPALLAAEITANLEIPVIGIGAGGDCDGQILVLQDILGITPGKAPRFAHDFMHGSHSIQEAIQGYVKAVKDKRFPAPEHAF